MTFEDLSENIKEAVKSFRKEMGLPDEATPESENISDLINNWIMDVRSYDKGNNVPLFNNKPRGYGQPEGSTDGRLRRKLVIEAVRNYVNKNPYLTKANSVANKLYKLVRDMSPLQSQQLKKALSLTAEKLRDPKSYKQKYARLVPFGENKWVKASHRFATLAKKGLPLPPDSEGKDRYTNTQMRSSRERHQKKYQTSVPTLANRYKTWDKVPLENVGCNQVLPLCHVLH